MKVHVKSFGCSANHAEAEIIKGQYENVSEDEAEMVVINICTVKGDKNALNEIRKVKEKFPSKKIAVTGCVTQSIVEPIKIIDPAATLVNTHNILNLTSLASTNTDALQHAKPVKLMKPRVRMNPVVGIVPICSGCLDACAFCSTRLVKGTLFSFPPEIIVKEVEKCVSDGCKEIWITGQDTCCYGFDRGTNLAELMEKVVQVSGDFKVRIGMGNPRHVTKYLNQLIAVMKHGKIFKFLHIPVQAGNNRVLKAMRRGHTVGSFTDIVTSIRKEIPTMTISTDLIVGYPTETDEEFEESLQLVRDVGIDVVNISRFASRPGTHATSMEQVDNKIKKERSKKLREVHREVAGKMHEKWLGWEGEVIIDEKVKDGMGGRNYAYKQIIVRDEVPIGTIVKVKITEAHPFHLLGELIS